MRRILSRRLSISMGDYGTYYGNLVPMPPFNGEPDDPFLPLLADYLTSLTPLPSIRSIEKRHWSREW